jgi:hypothetical protein
MSHNLSKLLRAEKLDRFLFEDTLQEVTKRVSYYYMGKNPYRPELFTEAEKLLRSRLNESDCNFELRDEKVCKKEISESDYFFKVGDNTSIDIRKVTSIKVIRVKKKPKKHIKYETPHVIFYNGEVELATEVCYKHKIATEIFETFKRVGYVCVGNNKVVKDHPENKERVIIENTYKVAKESN